MEKGSEDTNQLWVHLSGLADGNVFAIYPKILEEIFLQEEQSRNEDHKQEIENTTLPSDMEWRLKIYFHLVEKQREMDDMPAESPALDKLKACRRWSRPDTGTDPWNALVVAPLTGAAKRMAARRIRIRDPPWGPRDLAKAARLLENPPLHVIFDEDQEMRRVYFLIYDVFRYKTVLEEALTDARFYAKFPEAEKRKSLAWLLLLDQQRRRWAKRDIAKDDDDLDQRKIRSRSRSRRKLSISSGRLSRDSSSESRTGSKISRDSSLDRRELRSYRTSMIRTKVRAVRELSLEAKEAIRLARESATAQKIQEDTSIEDTQPKYQKFNMENEFEHDHPELKLDEINSIKEEDSISRDTIDEFPDSAKSGGSFSYSEPLEYTISRSEMRKMMELSAGEIGQVLNEFDTVLWENRVRIAAALAKIRIRNKALTLSELLPAHLRDERVSASLYREVITGWVNVFKSRSISELVQRLNEMGYSYSTSKLLGPNQFKFDQVCPKFIFLRPAVRSELIESSLLSENIIILQEREFCLGAAALCRELRNSQIHGNIVQTHGTSPKAAGYLASQLRDWGTEQGHLLVFGAGDRKSEYEGFLKALGATNTKVFAERAEEASRSLWTGVVAALAAPPNSYSAVADPIDLVCSRGGDLGMLEVLTESEISLDGKNRVMKILEDQKRTLRLCMSKPEIQLIMYETHSALSAENEDMVRRAISEANRAARELHALRRIRARETIPKAPKCASQPQAMDTEECKDESDVELDEIPVITQKEEDKVNVDETKNPEEKDTKSPRKTEAEVIINEITEERKMSVENSSPRKLTENDKVVTSTLQPPIQVQKPTPTVPSPIDPDTEYANISVPDCDLFEEMLPSPLADFTPHDREGCFLARIQRKEIMRMNAKYMINVAEARGLFGGNAPPQKRPQQTKKKVETEEKTRKTKRKLTKHEMERIAAPTHAWMSRMSACPTCESDSCLACEACLRHHAAPPSRAGGRARLWWHLAARAALLKDGGRRLQLPRERPLLRLAVASPDFDALPRRPYHVSSVYAKVLKAIGD